MNEIDSLDAFELVRLRDHAFDRWARPSLKPPPGPCKKRCYYCEGEVSRARGIHPHIVHRYYCRRCMAVHLRRSAKQQAGPGARPMAEQQTGACTQQACFKLAE